MAGLVDLGDGIKVVSGQGLASGGQSSDPIQQASSLLNLQKSQIELANAPLARKKLENEVAMSDLNRQKAVSQAELAKSEAFLQEQDANIKQNQQYSQFYKTGLELLKEDPNVGAAYIKQVMPNAEINITEDGLAEVNIPSTKVVRGADGILKEQASDNKYTFSIKKGDLSPDQKAQLTGQWYERFQKNETISLYRDKVAFYNQVESLKNDKTNASDLALMINYMKVVDANSAVQQGELANIENTPGISDQVRGTYNKLLGGGTLSDEARVEFVKASKNQVMAARSGALEAGRQIADIAQRQGLDPKNVAVQVGDLAPSDFLLTDDQVSQNLNKVLGR